MALLRDAVAVQLGIERLYGLAGGFMGWCSGVEPDVGGERLVVAVSRLWDGRDRTAQSL